jgi:hypothetical protein
VAWVEDSWGRGHEAERHARQTRGTHLLLKQLQCRLKVRNLTLRIRCQLLASGAQIHFLCQLLLQALLLDDHQVALRFSFGGR